MCISDAITCATAPHYPPYVNLQEVAVCFGGYLLRGNRAQKINSSSYRVRHCHLISAFVAWDLRNTVLFGMQAFASPSYSHLATLGVDVEWKERYLLHVSGVYRPRFKVKDCEKQFLGPLHIKNLWDMCPVHSWILTWSGSPLYLDLIRC